MTPQMAAETAVDAPHWSFAHQTALRVDQAIADGSRFRLVLNTEQAETVKFEHVEIVLWGVGIILTTVLGASAGQVVTFATPIDSHTTELLTVVRPANTASDLVDSWWDQLERDLVMWEHQTYVDDPVVNGFDQLEVEVRLWARRFYEPTP
jgi:hypothetical protein